MFNLRQKIRMMVDPFVSSLAISGTSKRAVTRIIKEAISYSTINLPYAMG
jgi:hypothetical protein